MSKEGSPNGVPPNPFDTPEYLHRELTRLIAEQDAEEQRIRRKLRPTHDLATLSEIHTELEAIAFNADLTLPQLHEVFQQYGQDAPRILEYLTQNKANTPAEAHELLMREAGNEAGKQLVDPVRQAIERRFNRPKDPTERKLRQMDRHETRKRHKWGKRDVTRLYATWKLEEQWRQEDDRLFEDLIRPVQSSAKPAA